MNYQPDGKFFVTDTRTGQRGWLVDVSNPEKLVTPPYDDRRTMVRLDRPGQIILKQYSPEKWAPMRAAHPISEMAKAKICYAALRELANAMGDYDTGRRSMDSLHDTKRIGFMQRGPVALDPAAADDIRQELYHAMMKVLG